MTRFRVTGWQQMSGWVLLLDPSRPQLCWCHAEP
jgi:hypothetical protein